MQGAGSVLNLYPTNELEELRRKICQRNPQEALAEDWKKVGNDMRQAMGLPSYNPPKR